MGNYDNPFDLSPNDIYWRVRQMKVAEEGRWKQDLRAREVTKVVDQLFPAE